jgi:AAHS family 4-hydroxybenzoate transporter-like MFS transporter
MNEKINSSAGFSISEVIDSFKVNKFTWFMFFLLGFAMIFDGYTYMIVPYTMNTIQLEWGLSKIATSSLTSWSMIGIVAGAVISGLLSDKIGRKKTLTFAIAAYSAFTVPIYFAPSFAFFAVFSVAAGLGLGACVPVVTTVFSEITPTKQRSVFVTFGMAWMILGWFLAGVIATAVSASLGWRYCYLFGIIPFVYAVILFFVMPESVHWLVGKGRRQEAARVLARIEKAATGKQSHWDADKIIAPPKAKVSGPRALFSKKFTRVTIGIWLSYLMGSFVLYGINAWLPTIMREKGYISIAIFSNLAALVANITTGFVAEAIGRKKNLLMIFIVEAAAVIILSVSLGTSLVGFMLVAALLIGFTINYTLTSINPLMAEAYPTEFRNTGVAWGQAFGRIGAIIAPIVGGLIISPELGNYSNLGFFAIPAVIGALGVIFFIRKETKGKSIDQLADDT